ncbi:DUF1631 family protein [Sphaerotilus mobilis]|uniref:Uncharacterized protein DUF1631 n=1 Tax=Sphaerotilus mobilis TaxID=47994 RepID=A0A4Q7LAZ3_9BURK|nr:DUF1631 family protein [Sphaerotilus mobilis]RZS46810.1 uncharacterized protein DUF1631 [Sphaerotilus mobilis]
MAPAIHSPALASQARRFYFELLLRELPRVIKAVHQSSREQMSQSGSPELLSRRRDLVLDLPRLAPRWHQIMVQSLRNAVTPPPPGTPRSMTSHNATKASELALVDDDTIELEIVASRMALAIMDKVSWEFSDLRYRMSALERREELDTGDILRPNVIARAAIDGWRSAGLTLENWRTAQSQLHEEFGVLVHEGYHETNRWLIGQGVCTDVNLRPFIRRSREGGSGAASGHGHAQTTGSGAPLTTPAAQPPVASSPSPASSAAGGAPGQRYPTPTGFSKDKDKFQPTPETAHLFAPTVVAGLPLQTRHPGPSSTSPGNLSPAGASSGRGDVHEETRLMTRSPGLARTFEQAEMVLGRLNQFVSRQVPEFNRSTIQQPHPASPGLRAAIHDAQVAVRQRFDASGPAGGMPAGVGQPPVLGASQMVSAPALLQELQQRKQALKQAATTPVERATIEIVALMFQSLLTEERIPTSIRVWFARLQMPVLRVAVAEPDFFATTDHPARKLIDRMGACVMGFEVGSAGVSDELEKEIKRVVQVVEAYPDTGRRVFQTVLTEFERFLENYFKTTHAAASKGVSLAQQIEQRETLAIQYTIELRKMLNEVPVHDGVREFLFHVWADVLATTGVKSGQGSDATKQMQRAAADLIWLASAKVSREERSEAIRRLPPLLKKLREGMASAGVPQAKQDEYIQALNNSLAAAFSARTATIPSERLDELMMQMETLEELLPDADHIEIDESMVRDLSGHDEGDLEVVAEGGSMPTPAMLAWTAELQVGAWFKLDYRDRVDPVQLAWQGLRKQLAMFVTPTGRGIMFQKHRLAAFLQAGLLVPVEEESLTVRATRSALAKLDADPTRLLQ